MNKLELKAEDIIIIQTAVHVYCEISKSRYVMDNLPDDIIVRDFKDFQKRLNKLDLKLTKAKMGILRKAKRNGI